MHINEVNTHILPVSFEYHSPTSLDAALEMLSKHGEEACVLAGGTDLIVKMKQRIEEPRHVINIKGIGELRGIEEMDEGVQIGAATRLKDIERSKIIWKKLPIMHETVKAMASVQIRNMATVGGNLCNASPAADCAVALIALDAEAEIAGPSGTKMVALEEFFVGPGETVLKDTELMTRLIVPYPEPDSGSSFKKIGRTNLDVATVNAAAVVRHQGDTIVDARIVLGAVAPIPLRLGGAEAYLKGKVGDAEAFERAAEICCEGIRPISDVRSTAEYRLSASKALVMDALAIASGRARGV